MTLLKAARSLLLSWDILLAVVVTGLVSYALYFEQLSFEAAQQVFLLATTVLSILFSVFFAALAILIAGGDNEFVLFLSESGVYADLLWTFRVSLISLFVALSTAIALYVMTLAYDPLMHLSVYPNPMMIVFAFLSSYALFAAAHSSLDAMKYAEYRARFVRATRGRLEAEGEHALNDQELRK